MLDLHRGVPEIGDCLELRLHPTTPPVFVYVDGVERDEDDEVIGLYIMNCGAEPVLVDYEACASGVTVMTTGCTGAVA
jgi:hypothetical protein